MKTQAIRLLATAALFLAAVAPAAAQELKIGYVNSERVLREAAPAKAAQGKLEAEFSRRERDLNEQTARLKAAADKLQKEEPTLAEAEKIRRQRELVEQDRDLQRKRREFQEDLNQRKNEELASVVERANRVIKQIVYAGAPYSAFTDEMRKDGDILQIVRTWTFTNDTLRTQAVKK